MAYKMNQSLVLPEKEVSGEDRLRVPVGAFDGISIMRYAHIYRDRQSGGVERYLHHLDRGLLQRHRLTIVQMHLTRGRQTGDAIEIENVAKGRILWVPTAMIESRSALLGLPDRIGYIYRQLLQPDQQDTQGQRRAMFAAMLGLLHHTSHIRHRTMILSSHLSKLLQPQHIDLLAIHWLAYDTSALISHAIRTGVPFVFVNHFNNDRLSLPQARKWFPRAAGIGIVSNQGVPDHLRKRSSNLSDAVDAEFFAPERARTLRYLAPPVILLPARIAEGKGHRDMMEGARILLAKQVNFALCFAGAVDSEALHQELRRFADANGLQGRVLFLGEISADEMRDWYGASSIVVLPSDSEGLPRVLLEAQAMEKPIVTYDSGGTSEAIVPNQTGFLVKKGDVETLADKIGFLLQTETERLRMGERGRQFVCRKFSVSELIQRHESFYFSALSEVRNRRNSST